MSTTSTTTAAQGYVADPRNDQVLVWVNGALVPKAQAVVSVFDAGFGFGDGVWEGLRLVRGRILQREAHLDRLFEGARSIALDIPQGRDGINAAIDGVIAANRMTDGAHLRLMVTRGVKATANQDPRFLVSGPTVVVTAEYKTPRPETRARGLTLFTSTFRTSGPDVFDLHLNSHSRLNLIQALIQAINAGADEALMLDPRGFVASCNSTNFFVVRRGEIWTSSGAYSFRGITQRAVIDAARADGIRVHEGDFTLAQVYSADESFVTGTLGGVTAVTRIDGRVIGMGVPGPLTDRVRALYEAAVYPG
ncbi:MAG: aminotransferase class IV [Rhodobacter sp.]|uniref:aminotransferase class IV n=1 Tax=Pararhodobacter sp. TaxID=2127056 RepID=UPI001D718D68|nr:aminotransferase class IV [Pararhodobacter sp.]MCB1346585.1 aminotransferase class IV [Paracoccaceae bacterium]MCC0074219.1 aminotransferase class IV [Rhodobacter sp.]HPD93637.1 aminotransferase class IV [Pararhodobacter sp.]